MPPPEWIAPCGLAFVAMVTCAIVALCSCVQALRKRLEALEAILRDSGVTLTPLD